MKIKKSTFYFICTIFIILIAGFFMIKGKNVASASDYNENVFDGDAQKIVIGMKNYNYYPNTIKVKSGTPVSISLDSSVVGCFRTFTIRDFGIREYLITPQDSVEFTPTKPGTYTFSCSMGMGSGVLIVE